jgi:hypothetical protein
MRSASERLRGAIAMSALALALACGGVLAQTPMGVTEAEAGTDAPLAARYRVAVIAGSNASGSTGTSVVRQQEWVFWRQAGTVAINKGGTEEIWQRDAHGRISLQRVLHAQRTVVDYSAGELATLGIEVDWSELCRFGSAAGTTGVEWDGSLNLPARLTQLINGRTLVRFDLLEAQPGAPADWDLPSHRSAGYAHIDAADFGDMAYDPAVRVAESLDVQAGWRQATHRH